MSTKQFREKLEGYFVPGATVGSYGGGLDKVIDFDWNGGNWAVKVQAVNRDGSIDKRWPTPRVHSTQPNFYSHVY